MRPGGGAGRARALRDRGSAPGPAWLRPPPAGMREAPPVRSSAGGGGGAGDAAELGAAGTAPSPDFRSSPRFPASDHSHPRPRLRASRERAPI